MQRTLEKTPASNAADASRKAKAVIEGSSDQSPDIIGRWLSFVSENLYGYSLDGRIPEQFAISAKSRSGGGFTLSRFATVGGASRLVRRADHIRSDGQDRLALYLSARGDLGLSQLNREQVYSVGGLALLSAADPVEHTKFGSNDTVVFLMPRRFVEQRLVHVEEACLRTSAPDDPINALAADTLMSLQAGAARMTDDQFVRAANLAGEVVLMALAGADTVSDGSVRGANLARAKRLIRDRLEDPDLSVQDIAAACGFSTSYLHNLFRDDGRTVSEYLKVARLERARELLQRRHAPDVSVTDVALACGYSNMSQFSTAFRRAFGLTPRDVLMGR